MKTMAETASSQDPILVTPEVNLVRPTAPVVGRLVESTSCQRGRSESFVRHVAFDVTGTPLAGNILPGQAFGVIAPGEDERGKPHALRLYSTSSPSWGEDGNGNVIATCVKRLIDERKPQKEGDDPEDHSLFLGVCSNYMCDMRVGDEAMLTGPSGKRFVLPENPDAHDYVFLATGTGVAPFRAMVLELLRRPGGPTPSRVALVQGVPYTTTLLYDDLFRELADEHENFSYHTAISREPMADGRRGRYVHHLLQEELGTFGSVLQNSRTLVYACGLLGMQFGLYQMLAGADLADAYLTVDPSLSASAPSDWTNVEMKRKIKPTHRCMIEVY